MDLLVMLTFNSGRRNKLIEKDGSYFYHVLGGYVVEKF
jgi:hypothetical protein